MITQLNPMLPVTCPAGNGQAIALIDYSENHHLIFVIALDDTGEIWPYPNTVVSLKLSSIKNEMKDLPKDLYCRY